MSLERSFDLPDVDKFVSGTVGEPGARVFFLQAVAGSEVVTLKVEKQQVSALADYLESMMVDLPEPGLDSVPDTNPLTTPIEVDWSVGSMGVAYVESRDRIALWAEQIQLDDEAGAPATGRFQLTRGQVTAFIRDSRILLLAGRPPCPYCTTPLNDDSWCPCWN